MNIKGRTEAARLELVKRLEVTNFGDRAIEGIEVYKSFYDLTAYLQSWDETQKIMSEQKFLHTLRVTQNMLELAEEAPGEMQEIYFWLGLLHDIGRVNDIGRATFKGLGHPQAGAAMLYKRGLIDIFPTRERIDHWALEWGVRLHGVKSLEEDMAKNGLSPSDEVYKMWQDIRTADKKDIYDFLLYIPLETTVGAISEEIASVPVSDQTLYELTHEMPVDRGLKGEEYTHMRHYLSHIGFHYDNLDPRLVKWLVETDWTRKYMDLLPGWEENPRLVQIWKAAEAFLQKKLKE